MRLENTDAFGSRFRVIGKQNSKSDGKSLISRVASCEGSHPCDCRGLASGCCIQGLVVGHRDLSVRGMIAIHLPIDAHGIVGFALPGQLTRMAQLIALSVRAAQPLDSGDVRIARTDFAQTSQCLI